ncbi:glycosyltransferase family 2 protein [Thermodesulfobacteriota bacterium]
MPVYNGGSYLREAIQSLLSQSHREIELIISDNASTDDTSAVCQRFAETDSRVKYFRQKINRRAKWNFNFVLQQANAPYFMWAAHDDVWDAGWIKVLLQNFSDTVAISFGHVVNIDKKGRVVRQVPPLHFPGNQRQRMLRYFLAEELNGKANIIYGLYRTDLLKKFTMKDYSHCKFGQDMIFVYDYMQYGTVRTDPSILIYKRIPENTLQNTVAQKNPTLLTIERFRYYINHIYLTPNLVDKLLLIILMPFKFFQTIFFKTVFSSRRYF